MARFKATPVKLAEPVETFAIDINDIRDDSATINLSWEKVRVPVKLQLDLIERALLLWSNLGDTVLSPFMGIGSEGVVSLKQRRRFIGVELKRAYFERACRHLDATERGAATLFDAA